jgi:hypothetical protein
MLVGLSDTNQQAAQDVQILRDFVGNDGTPFTRAQEERIGDAWELYLFEGKAPSIELAGVFDRMKAWFARVYRSIKPIVDRQGVELNDEVRGVFDRMLATEEEIAEAQNLSETAPLIADMEEAGLTETEARQYATAVAAAQSISEAELLAKKMGEIKRARAKEKLEIRAGIEAEVEAEFAERPEYVALVALTQGRTIEGDELPNPIKLDEAVLDERFPGRKGSLARGRDLVYAKEGVTPDEAADIFGYPSGEALLDALTNLPPFQRTFDQEVAQRMAPLLKEADVSEGALANAAIDAVHGDERMKYMMIELRALSRKSGTQRPATVAAAKQAAKEAIARRTVRTAIQSSKFLQAERQAAKKAHDAVVKEDWAEASKQQINRILQHQLYMERPRSTPATSTRSIRSTNRRTFATSRSRKPRNV